MIFISVFSLVVVVAGDWFWEGFMMVMLLSFFSAGGFTMVVLLSFFSAGGFTVVVFCSHAIRRVRQANRQR